MPTEVVPSWVRQRARNWLVPCSVGILLLAGGYLLATGAFAPKVIFGRNWPREELVSFGQVDHRLWDELLQRYVDESGLVDYASWKSSTGDIAALDAYLTILSRADAQRHDTREAQLAFWINAYNALTVRGILREYPTLSIQDHAPRVGGYNIWRDLLLRVGDESYSLGQIEHRLLRPMHEPRIHFAIVCASHGCPRLLNRAYTAADLERQLQANSLHFFADPDKCAYDGAGLGLSPILDWYAEDFGPTRTDLLKSIAPYLPEGVATYAVSDPPPNISFLEYDWSLNDQVTIESAAPLPPNLPTVDVAESPLLR